MSTPQEPAPAHPAPVKRSPALRLLIALVLCAVCAVLILLFNKGPVGVWLLRRAERSGAQVLAKPAAADPQDVNRVIERLRDVDRFAGGSRAATKALQHIGRLYMAKGRCPEAREAFEPLCRLAPRDADMCMMSRIYIGRCYEDEGNVDVSVQTYLGMEQYHPWTTLWLEAPVYAAEVYERHGMDEQAAAAYRRAKDLALNRLRDTLDQNALDTLRWQLGLIHEGLGEWQDAARVYEFALSTDNRHDMRQRAEMWYRLGRLYEERLQQPAKAGAAYRQLMDEFPRHSAALQAAEAIKRLAGRRDAGGP